MMNLYREEEKEKVPFKEKIKRLREDIKLERETGTRNRRKTINDLTNRIPTASESDLEELSAMKEVIVRLDLDDPRRGEVLDEKLIKMLDEKLAKAQQKTEEEQGRQF